MNNSIHAASSLVAAFLFTGLFNAQVLAQAAVRESSGEGRARPAAVQSTPARQTGVTGQQPAAVATPAQSSASFEISYQMQLLQEEIMALRGLIEEQNFELKRLKQQRIDDYIDIDKRLLEIRQEQDAVKQQLVTAPQAQTPAILQPTTGLNLADEREIYNQAIGQLLDKQDYAAAKQGFNDYLEKYTGGTFTPNVYYWLGQIYLTEANDKEAESLFNRILSEYPKHQKAPDAQFKLAKIYFEKGDKVRSKGLMDELAAGSSDSSRLAKAFVEKNFP